MAAVSGRKLGKELCDVLGLDPNVVRSITITCPANYAATITVEQYAQHDDVTAIGDEVRKYRPTSRVDIVTYDLEES